MRIECVQKREIWSNTRPKLRGGGMTKNWRGQANAKWLSTEYRRPKKAKIKKNLKIWADVAYKICFGRTLKFGSGSLFSAVQWRQFSYRASLICVTKPMWRTWSATLPFEKFFFFWKFNVAQKNGPNHYAEQKTLISCP